MKSGLAVNGGPKAADNLAVPPWPPTSNDVADRLRQMYLSRKWSFNGPHEMEFAARFARHHNAAYGVMMANGTVTLECILTALGVGRGDEVIVPAFTWIATAMAVAYTGAKPVLVDCEPDTWCLDPAGTEAAITPRTKAIIAVHLYGSMAHIDRLTAVAAKHSIPLIEDCAHAHGGK